MLGHAHIQATEVYTHVSVKALKKIHTATHPGASLEPAARATEEPAGLPLSSLATQSEDA